MGGGGADESVGPGTIDADEDNHGVVLPLAGDLIRKIRFEGGNGLIF
jgi:hypothetical protein